MTPPMYHVSRGAWPQRRAAIARHYEFWSPLHRALATSVLVGFDHLSADRLLQRVTYRRRGVSQDRERVRLTINFSDRDRGEYPAFSVTVDGDLELEERVYVARAR